MCGIEQSFFLPTQHTRTILVNELLPVRPLLLDVRWFVRLTAKMVVHMVVVVVVVVVIVAVVVVRSKLFFL